MKKLIAADLFCEAGGTSQGFPPSYIFRGTKADVTKQIGNSVSPTVAEAITRTLAG